MSSERPPETLRLVADVLPVYEPADGSRAARDRELEPLQIRLPEQRAVGRAGGIEVGRCRSQDNEQDDEDDGRNDGGKAERMEPPERPRGLRRRLAGWEPRP